MIKYNHITNEVFLQTIYQDSYPKALVTSFTEDPGAIPKGQEGRCWHVQPFNPIGFPPGNQYYCTSTFHGVLRRKSEFECMHLIVVDDVDEKIPEFMMNLLPEPSFKLKTSEHSEQWGFFIQQPLFDYYSAKQCSNLIDGFIAKLTHDGKDPGMAGVTRLVRLPQGTNNKAGKPVLDYAGDPIVSAAGIPLMEGSRLIDGWRPFECELIHWEPENRYTQELLADCLGIDINAPRNEGEGGGMGYEGSDHPVYRIFDELGLIKHAGNGVGAYEVVCAWDHEHSQGGGGTQIQLFPDGGASLDCKHRCSGRPRSDFKAWLRAQTNYALYKGEWDFKLCSDAFAADQAKYNTPPFIEGAAAQQPVGSCPVSVMPADIEAEIFHKLKTFFDGNEEAAGNVFFRKPLRMAWPQVFYNGNRGKAFLFNDSGTLIQCADNKILEYIRTIHGDFLDIAAIHARGAEAGLNATDCGKFTTGLFRCFMKRIEIDHQRDSIEFAVDMFADHSHMQVHKAGVNVTYSYRPLVSQNPLALMGQIDDDLVDRVVRDYKEHFAGFDNFLNLLKTARFAPGGREAFLWLNAQSDWGKTFLLNGVMGEDLGIVTEASMKEIEKVFEGTPIGKTAQDFIYSWVLFCDEAKIIKSEAKQLDSWIAGSPKHQLSFKTRLYTKIFASATDIPSFGGEMGIETQFDNRFGYLSPQSKKLNERALFDELGSLIYRGALSTYVASELNQFVAEMRVMGPLGAAKFCEHQLHAIHEEWRVSKTQGDLNESLEVIAEDMKRDLIKISEGTLSLISKNNAQYDMAAMWNSDHIIVGWNKEHGRVIQMVNATKMIETWIPVKFSKSEVGKVMVMKSALLDLLHEGEESHKNATRITKDNGEHERRRGPIIIIPVQSG